MCVPAYQVYLLWCTSTPQTLAVPRVHLLWYTSRYTSCRYSKIFSKIGFLLRWLGLGYCIKTRVFFRMVRIWVGPDRKPILNIRIIASYQTKNHMYDEVTSSTRKHYTYKYTIIGINITIFLVRILQYRGVYFQFRDRC